VRAPERGETAHTWQPRWRAGQRDGVQVRHKHRGDARSVLGKLAVMSTHPTACQRRGQKTGGAVAVSGEDCNAVAGGGFGSTLQHEREVGNVRRRSTD
jgi:hypothetical protein